LKELRKLDEFKDIYIKPVKSKPEPKPKEKMMIL
jgi:hypothetical protein